MLVDHFWISQIFLILIVIWTEIDTLLSSFMFNIYVITVALLRAFLSQWLSSEDVPV